MKLRKLLIPMLFMIFMLLVLVKADTSAQTVNGIFYWYGSWSGYTDNNYYQWHSWYSSPANPTQVYNSSNQIVDSVSNGWTITSISWYDSSPWYNSSRGQYERGVSVSYYKPDAVSLSYISLSPSSMTINGTNSTGGQFIVYAHYSNGTTQDVTTQTYWSTNNTSVAWVADRSNGTAYSRGSTGMATITAYYPYGQSNQRTASATVTVTQASSGGGGAPVLSLSASPTSITSGGSSTLTLTSNINIGPTPYSMQIYDQTANQVITSTGTGTTLTYTVTLTSSHTYIGRTTGGTTNSSSNTVTVSVGSSGGGGGGGSGAPVLSLSASPTSVTSGGSSTITLTSNINVGPTIYYLRIYDQTAGTYLTNTGSGTTSTTTVTLTSSHTYVGRATNSSGTIYSSSNAVTVSVASSGGGGGSGVPVLSLSASPTSVTYGGSSTITLTSNIDVGPTPYYLRIYDQTAGQYLTNTGSGTTSTTTVTLTSNHTYVGRATDYSGSSVASSSNSVAITVTQPVTLTSIALSQYSFSGTQPSTLLGSLTVTATYSNGTTRQVAPSTNFYNNTNSSVGFVTPGTATAFVYTNSSYGTTTITPSYTENGITRTSSPLIITFSQPAPVAPTGLSAVGVNGDPTKINLTWTAVTGASSYKVYYSSGTLIASNVTTASYQVTGLTSANTAYSFQVSAVNASGLEGSKSSVATATTAPNAPTGLTATAASANQINLSWTAPAGGASSYDVYANGTRIATGITTVLYNATGLTSGTTYTFYVAAKNTQGINGPQSNNASAVPFVMPTITSIALTGPRTYGLDASVSETGTSAVQASYRIFFTTSVTAPPIDYTINAVTPGSGWTDSLITGTLTVNSSTSVSGVISGANLSNTTWTYITVKVAIGSVTNNWVWQYSQAYSLNSSSLNGPDGYIGYVGHNQIITVNGTQVVLTDPDTPDSDYGPYSSAVVNSIGTYNTFIDGDYVKYRLEFDVTNPSQINDIGVNLYLAGGIDIQLTRMALEKQQSNGSFAVIKDLTSSYIRQGVGRYSVLLGNDNSGTPMIRANGSGRYAVQYEGRLSVATFIGRIITNVQNLATISVYSNAASYPYILQMQNSGRKFYINTKTAWTVQYQ